MLLDEKTLTQNINVRCGSKIYNDQVQHLWIFKFYLKVSIKDQRLMVQILATAAQYHSHQNRINFMGPFSDMYVAHHHRHK